MTYTPPAHFAVENRSKLVSDRDVAYWTEACRRQLVEDVCPAWGLAPPGAAIYPPGTTFPANLAMLAVIVDDIGDPGTLGEHGLIGNVPFVLIDAHLSEQPSVVLSHEFIEATVNVNLDRWTDPIPRHGRLYQYPLEACDPVQAATYQKAVHLLDGARLVAVSNFVYPEWFNVATTTPGRGRFDHLGQLVTSLEIAAGGYAAPEIDGRVTFIGQGEMHMSARKFMPWGRAARLLWTAGRREASRGER